MTSGTHLRTGAMVLFALLAFAAQPSARSQTFTTFDPPGSILTAPSNINAAGQIAGTYFDSTFAQHGFVRNPDGTISSFDVPGSEFLAAIIMTQQGLVVGSYSDANGSHIFKRAANGTITTLEPPSPGAFIYAVVVNTSGAIGGAFIDPNGNVHGFVRAAGGKYNVFPVPPALIPSFFLPNITALTLDGTLVGALIDASFASHGFLLSANGNVTTFDAPNALPSFFGGPSSVNDSGIITGFFNDGSKNGDLRVFLRASNGAFSSFDTPQVETFPGAAVINSSGAVAGNVQNTVCGADSCTTTLVSFLRAANGTVKQVNDPQAVPGPQSTQGTGVVSINAAGEMIGYYSDTNGVQHGFVAVP